MNSQIIFDFSIKTLTMEASPLHWPAGWPRTPYQKRIESRFGSWRNRPTVAKSTSKLTEELRLFGAKDLILSTNLNLRNDGLPRSGQITPEDTGTAAYFTFKGDQRVIACDSFTMVGCNIWAIAKTIEAMRGIERWGCTEILDRAFSGFMALPEKASDGIRSWYNVLGVEQDATPVEINKAYRRLSKVCHPDAGGSIEEWNELRNAYSQAFTNV